MLLLAMAGSATAYTWNFETESDYWLYNATWSSGKATVPSNLPSEDEASVFARLNTQTSPLLYIGDISGGGYTVTNLNNPPGTIYGSLYLSPTGGPGSTVLILLSPMSWTGGSGNYTYTFDGDTPADYRTRIPPGDWSVYDPARSGTFDEVKAMIQAIPNTDYAAFFGPQIGMSGTFGTTFKVTQIRLTQRAKPDTPVTWTTGGAYVEKLGNNGIFGVPGNPTPTIFDWVRLDGASGSLNLSPGAPQTVLVNPLTFGVGQTGGQPGVWYSLPTHFSMARDITVNGITKSLVLVNPMTHVVNWFTDSLLVQGGPPVTFGNIIVTPLGWPAGFFAGAVGVYTQPTIPPVQAQFSVADAILSLDVPPESLYVQPGKTVTVTLNQSNLQVGVNTYQAWLSFETAKLSITSGDLDLSSPPSPYNKVGKAAVSGTEIDLVALLQTDPPTTTQADAKLATMSFTAGASEGTTQVTFRTEDPPTMLSDPDGNEILPTTVNSPLIWIDGTPPVIVTVPANGTSNPVTVATQTITGWLSDTLSGVDTLTYRLNSGPIVPVPSTNGAFSQTVVLVPGGNTVVFTLTDKAGNTATSTINYTYTQPAPGITIFKSVAPNRFGGASYPAWQANSRIGVMTDTSPVGSGYATYENVTTDQDYTVDMVSTFNSWLGILGSPGEYGNRLTYLYRIDNGVRTNPGAAKLDLNKVSVGVRDIFNGADNTPGDDYTWAWGYDWVTRADPAGFGAGNARLKGYNWNASTSSWDEVVGGRLADRIIFDNGPGYANDDGAPATQATLNDLYKQLSGAVINRQFESSPTKRQTLTKDEYEVTYTGHASVGDADVTATTNYKSADSTPPVVTITTADVSPSNNNVFNVVGTVADDETLASGVRSVEVKLNNVRVYYDSTATATSFSVAVSLTDGSTGNVITVIGKDFAGNQKTETINVPQVGVTVTLQSVTASLTRWIKFVIGGDGSGTAAPVPVTKQVAFTTGFGTTTLFLPKAGLSEAWTKLSAKDEQHTLRRTVAITGGSASMTLTGGDLTNDNLIDVRDFGVFAGQYGTSPPLNTQWTVRNADINCVPPVDSLDFTYIQINFLGRGDPEPGKATAALGEPMTSITVKELAKIVGERAAQKADVNNDRIVDAKDIALFIQKMDKPGR
jgi:hypothetical protein